MHISGSDCRLERDSLGEVEVPKNAYFGAQTVRAIDNFPMSGVAIGTFPNLIRALAFVKKAAALTNAKLGNISVEKAKVISDVCDELIAGKLFDSFPVDVFQGGAGTSTNMNMNEVIANRGLEMMGLPRGAYIHLHPNNDVNCAQSTNDVYPSAVRVAILLSQESLICALNELVCALERKADDFSQVIKLGRTQLQDAVPMTLGQEFRAFASTFREDIERLSELSKLFTEMNLGGTAIGTGINTDPRYREMVVTQLAELTRFSLKPAADLIEACWDTGAFVLYSGMLKRLATKLSKVCNDLRLLSSGPRGGFGEINLPAQQPGSSIMPGKVNPVVPEVVNQVAFQIIGFDLTVTLASEAGQLQLNVMEPIITYNIFQSLRLLTNSISILTERCIKGISANADRCLLHLQSSAALATALSPVIGYESASKIAKEAIASGKQIRDVVLTHQPWLVDYLDQKLKDPLSLTEPGQVPTDGH